MMLLISAPGVGGLIGGFLVDNGVEFQQLFLGAALSILSLGCIIRIAYSLFAKKSEARMMQERAKEDKNDQLGNRKKSRLFSINTFPSIFPVPNQKAYLELQNADVSSM